MSANRYLLRLYRWGVIKREREESLDPGDVSRLRELLMAEVNAVAGTLRLDLSKGWKLHVLGLPNRRVVAKVSVDRSGRTAVKR